MREPAFEAVAGVDTVNVNLTRALVLLINAPGRLASRRGATSSAMASKRPHDPPHLHAFSLLV